MGRSTGHRVVGVIAVKHRIEAAKLRAEAARLRDELAQIESPDQSIASVLAPRLH